MVVNTLVKQLEGCAPHGEARDIWPQNRRNQSNVAPDPYLRVFFLQEAACNMLVFMLVIINYLSGIAEISIDKFNEKLENIGAFGLQ